MSVSTYYDDGQARLLCGDVREALRSLPAASVHCCVTSPPYWGLRNYGIDGQIGLEQSPDEFVQTMVEVFREVRRVLRPDATLWLNLGDSYAANRGYQVVDNKHRDVGNNMPMTVPDGLKPKDLCMIPARVALALQSEGWWLRSAITWCKKSCMPESVTDRPTSATEQIFLLAPSASYFYDAEAVRLPHQPESIDRMRKPMASFRDRTDQSAPKVGNFNNYTDRETGWGNPSGANLRNYWLLGPEPTPFAHFACVDEATECLTQEGWKKHSDLRVGELIAGYSMDDQRLRWRPLDDVARYQVQDEPLVHAKAASLDMVLTPNHRCVVQRRKLGGGHSAPKIKRADELTFSDHIPTAAEWDVDGEPFDPAWAELLGWYVAEGHAIRGSMAVEISQSLSANAPKVERLRELLTAIDADWKEASAIRDWRGRETQQCWFRISGYAAARLRELAPNKELTADVLRWDTAAIRALMDGLIAGDGHVRRDDRRMSFIQKNKHIADIVQAMAVRLGWSARLSTKGADMFTLYFTAHTRRSLRGTAGTGAEIEEYRYTGTVWCPKTKDGTWVARRNGTVFITGNTFPTEIPRRAILAGTSDKGVCPECGAPWVRVVERKAMVVRRTDWGEQAGNRTASSGTMLEPPESKTVGWKPSCAHDAEPIPATVLDPFIGSGTTCLVAKQLGRRSIGIDLNPEYLAIAADRVRQLSLFSGVSA